MTVTKREHCVLNEPLPAFTTVIVHVYNPLLQYMFVCGDVGLLIGDHVHRDSCVIVNDVTTLNVPVTDNGADQALGLIVKLNAEHCGISRLHAPLHPSQLAVLPSSHCSQIFTFPSPQYPHNSVS